MSSTEFFASSSPTFAVACVPGGAAPSYAHVLLLVELHRAHAIAVRDERLDVVERRPHIDVSEGAYFAADLRLM